MKTGWRFCHPLLIMKNYFSNKYIFCKLKGTETMILFGNITDTLASISMPLFEGYRKIIFKSHGCFTAVFQFHEKFIFMAVENEMKEPLFLTIGNALQCIVQCISKKHTQIQIMYKNFFRNNQLW